MATIFSAFVTQANAISGKITVARAFYELARQNNTAKIEMLLDRGYSMESVDERGYNPVCLSVIRQDRTTYQTLVSYGASKSPNCMKKIPESVYKRFFGYSPVKTATTFVKDSSDMPYWIGAGILGAGAVATAIALRGDSGGSGSEPGPGPGPEPEKYCQHGVYNYDTQKCDCDSGYGNYGDNTTCYATIENCASQSKNICNQCNERYYLENNTCYLDPGKVCEHGVYNYYTQKCDCDYGYGNYGDNKACYATVSNCETQYKANCTKCLDTYHLKNNVCYASVRNCEEQDGPICTKCNEGFGVHGGDGTYCYVNIANCATQTMDICSECVSGYGTHGDESHCYQDIENCMTQIQTACSHCNPGYDTYDNPDRDVCYSENPCAAYVNTIPVKKDGEVTCVCNENKGYYGEPGSCTQNSEGEYHEGDGDKEEWNNLNEKYCHSHGKYDTISGLCLCYRGYANSTNGCSECADTYLNFSGRCYPDLNCRARGEGYIQYNDRCLCDANYFEFEGTCTAKVQCDAHKQQYLPGPDKETACKCKPNFNEDCTDCKAGYTLDTASDTCIKTEEECEEKWQGPKCNRCPPQYAETIDGEGNKHCGMECAANRAPIEENPLCELCADGYDLSPIDGTCVVSKCETGVDGYIRTPEGYCICDEEHGYAMSPTGECVHKGDDVIGIKDSNINNSTIEINNDGEVDEFHDLYGMKPLTTDEDENIVYYDDVYNALSSQDEERGTIIINNANTGQNSIYGIYSPLRIYNAAAVNKTDATSSAAIGKIEIIDSNSNSIITGINNTSDESIYNAYAYNITQGTAMEPTLSEATAEITIAKDKTGRGVLTGINGYGNIINAFSNTTGGLAANARAKGLINIENRGNEDVIGIHGNNVDHRINNAYAYLDSPISDSVAEGEIKVSGNKNVIGILNKATVVNSETQFSKEFNKVNNFRAIGIIEATANSEWSAYGIRVYDEGMLKAHIYNALGYNSYGEVIVRNTAGANAFGLYNAIQKYIDIDGEKYYNNTYNAFRSSEKYGGDNVEAKGTVTIELSGNSNAEQNGIGIYAAGNVFNSYVNSGSDIKLEAIGNINIDDSSSTAKMALIGIESGGATIANAYATGKNLNTDSISEGNINVNIIANKDGSGSGIAAGMYSGKKSDMDVQIFNAALEEDTSNVRGNISVKATASPFSKIYGIYASRYAADEDPGQVKTVYNAYYSNADAAQDAGSVYGTITVSAPRSSSASYAEYFGIYVNEGTAYNVYTTNKNADVRGLIDVAVAGGANSGIAVGMFGNESSLYNSGSNAVINVSTTMMGTDAYGMKGEGSYIENNGEINVTSERSKAYGLYANRGQIVNNVDGILNVTGSAGSYGIYAVAQDDEGELVDNVQVINLGTINLTGTTQNIGIYASGSNATVENHGLITINGTPNTIICEDGECGTDVAIVLDNGAHLINGGAITSAQSLNLNANGGNILLTQGGKFESEESISGNIDVANEVILNNFENEIILEDALAAKDISKVTVGSKSYLYDTSITGNENGSYDVVAQMKDFSQIADNKQEAEYFATNYAQKKNMELFNALKTASSPSQATMIVAQTTGKSMLPNIPEEELKVQRGLDKAMMDELFKHKNDDVRKIVGGSASYIGRDDHGTLTGYDLKTRSMYMLYDKKLDNRYRLGAGLSITHTDTDYNDDSTRKNMMVQGYVPLSYSNNKGLSLVSMLRLGYADGEYTRRGYNNKSYKSDTSEITYGLLNEARYTKDMGYFNLTPFIGLNAIGWYWDNMDEGKDSLALHTDSSTVLSLESALGVYLDKEIEFNHDNRLNMALGLGYYHEFANPYKGLEVHNTGTVKRDRIKNKMNSRDRGIISAVINYDYKDFSVYGELMQYLEREHPVEVEGGLKYKF